MFIIVNLPQAYMFRHIKMKLTVLRPSMLFAILILRNQMLMSTSKFYLDIRKSETVQINRQNLIHSDINV